ncbi:MAG: tryptophanase [Deltaproteobacteria bacterium]|jgi:tryptophanase|nr:tryptophanase [Deltaproteobacteria bacterium]
MSDCSYTRVTFFSGENVPLEMHKARMVQRVHLIPIKERFEVLNRTGNNTFLLPNRDVFLDMLTDSGVNAMSEAQYAAMLMADDSYAGSETFYRLEKTIRDFFGLEYFLPAHQGRACENILASTYVTPQTPTVITNYHFTTTKAHIMLRGGQVLEAISDAGLMTESDLPFKGNYDLDKFDALVKQAGGPAKIAFVRIEAGTNLIGGQPVSLDNMRQVSAYCRKNGLRLVYDASLLADNLFFIKTREKECQNRPLADLVKEIASLMDIIYFSGRKLGCARGGGICAANKVEYLRLRDLVPLYEGFLTYGGMSVREMEAMAVGIRETLDIHNISQTPLFVEALGKELEALNVPVVTPYGGLGCHVDASRFVPHIPQVEYPAAALCSAIYLVSGVRGMERGTLSESRNPDGSEHLSNMELVRLAIPKRVFTHSQIKFAADRIGWLYRNRSLIGGLTFEDEPKTLRFFLGRLKPIGDWQERLMAKYLGDMPSGL